MNDNQKKLFDQVPKANTSELVQYSVNERIPLYEGELEIKDNGKVTLGNGRIWSDWNPNPTLRFGYNADLSLEVFLNLPKVLITIKSLNINLEGMFTTVTTNKNSEFPFVGIANQLTLKEVKDLKRVTFHLPNVPLLIGLPVKFENRTVNGRITLHLDNWRITLDPVSDIQERIKNLRNVSGYAITYIGVLEKTSDISFSSDEARDILNCLSYLLSFSLGYWTSTMFYYGYNSSHELVWQEWSRGRCSTYEPSVTWFDIATPKVLSEIFPGFFKLWKDELWGEDFSRALYWYIEANKSSTTLESAIITTQAALELLIWVHFIEDKKIISSVGFDKLFPSDRIRLALSQLGIDSSIPDILNDLTEFARILGCEDGPHVLTEIRNNLIHPTKTNRRKLVTNSTVKTRFQAQEIGLWYLELFILWLCKFNGKYAYRLRFPKYQGQVQDVPWVQKS